MNLVKHFTKNESMIFDQSKTNLPPVLEPVKSDNKQEQQFYHHSVFCVNLQERVIKLIKSAKQTLILSTFLLADEDIEQAILEAAERKVRVYVLLACETRLGGEVPDDEFGKMCLTQHKAMLNKLSGLVHFSSAPHFHAKVVIADSLHNTSEAEARGLLLTANLTSEALTRNEELAVSLNQKQIAELTAIFRWAIFESAEHHMIHKGEFASYKSPCTTLYPTELTEILVTSSEDVAIKHHALKMIQQANKELIISSFGWQEDHQLIKAICKRAEAGVKVTILSRQRPAAMPSLLAMKQAGASVKCFKWLHAKAILIDGQEAMVMSANFQTHGMDEGFELGVKLVGDQVTELKHCLENFLTKQYNELRTDMTLGMISGDFEAWENNKFISYSANEISVVELPPIEANCLSDMSKKPNITDISWQKYTSHKVKFDWIVKPPVLTTSYPEYFMPIEKKVDKNNKQQREMVRKSYTPKVVKLNKNQLAITVCKESDFELAQKLKQVELPNASIVLEVR